MQIASGLTLFTEHWFAPCIHTEILTDRQKPILGLIEKSDLVDTILRKCT